MINLSLVEISKEKRIQKRNRSSSFSYAMCMITYPTDENETKTKDVTDYIRKGTYYLKTTYTLIFLYDFFGDDISREFITTYGGKLHNDSSSNMTILTYYDSNMVNNWKNVINREKLEADDRHNGEEVLKVVDNIKEAYGVNKLPAIIVVKNNNGVEESFPFPFSYNNKESMYRAFKDLINLINDNCEEKFETIQTKICGPEAKINKNQTIEEINTFNFIYDLVKDKAKQGRYTQEDLAQDLDISVRTLRDKREKDKFTREEVLTIGIIFNLDIERVNDLLRMNNQLDLGITFRDGVIRNCLLNGYDVHKTNDELMKYNYDTLNKL